jgi:acylphosphatase
LNRAGRLVTIGGDVQRRTYYFGGHVQGVGFRYSAQNLARNYPVTGFVRNLPDGRVEMVAEGETKDLDALVDVIQRQMEGFIKKTDIATANATGEFAGFTIRH